MILVCGEALIDIFVGAETHGRMALEGCPGGSPFNVAFGLARLGQPVAFLASLSRDLIGQRLHRFLREEGVGEAYLRRSDRPSTLSIVDLTSGTPAYAFYGAGAADRDISDGDIGPLPDAITALHFGSFSTVVEPVGSAFEALARRESGQRIIAYDPNIRPTIEPDMAVWRRKVATMAAHAHILKISDEDFHLLYGEADPVGKALEWLAAGVRLVVMTRGANGILAWTATQSLDMPAPATTVIDTVGAGDTFQAALLTALNETGHLSIAAIANLPASTLQACLRFAIAAAAITVSRRGADMPRRRELAATIIGE